MRPNTPHYVLTMDNSITIGRNFYARSTIRNSCWGYLHTTLLPNTTTNTHHSFLLIMLRSMFADAVQAYFLEEGESGRLSFVGR